MLKALTSRRSEPTRRGVVSSVLHLCASLPAFVLAVAVAAGSPGTGNSEELEYRVKAAYLYNFARFVDWPNSVEADSGRFVIGVLGKDPFGAVLRDTVRGKRIRGQSLEVRNLGELSEAARCDLLFISTSERRELKHIIASLEGSVVLTVSEADSFLDTGGMLNFVIDRERVRFEVNLDAVREAGLDVSSQLLKVARDVRFKGK